jgi:hypothetical protein
MTKEIDIILSTLKGMDVDDALKTLEDCKELILSYSVVSFPWDRLKNIGETNGK